MSSLMTIVTENTYRDFRRLQGDPTMTIVRPIAQWTLPSGYAYDDVTDTIRHTSTGAVSTNYSTYWSTDSVDMMPLERSDELRNLILAGIVKEGSFDTLILPDDYATVYAGFRALVDSVEYNILTVRKYPFGVSTAFTYLVRLERRA